MVYSMRDGLLPAWMPGSQRGRQPKSSPWRFAALAIIILASYRFFSESSLMKKGLWSKMSTSRGQIEGRRILVTGGGGNIGMHIVHRLLAAGTPVTVVDKIFYHDELPPSSPSLLRVYLGDIRNTTVLSSAFTPDVAGVIHLAAISRPEWCADNELDCWDVNERSTQLVLDEMTKLNQVNAGKRWFILASSTDVYGDAVDGKYFDDLDDVEHRSANVYGATKLAAESAVQAYLRSYQLDQRHGSLHAVSLRLPTVYGSTHDHVERLIPSIVTQALSHQVIQFFDGSQSLDLLHIDDCVEAFQLAIAHLQQSTDTWWQWSHQRTSFRTFNIGSGILTPAADILDMLVKLARSKSPIRRIPGDAGSPRGFKVPVEEAAAVLGFRTSVGVEEGLRKLIHEHIHLRQEVFADRLNSSCGSAAPSLVANRQLEKLHECVVHIQVDVQGEFLGLQAPHRDRKARMNWTMSPDELSPEPRLLVSVSSRGKETIMRIRGVGSDYFLGVLNPVEGPVTLTDVLEEDLEAGAVIDWALKVNLEESTVRLTLPDGSHQLMPPSFLGSGFSLVPATLEDVYPFRITPICCPSPAPWPFMYDDPIEFTADYQRTSLKRPFRASPAKALCNRLERAHTKLTADITTLPSVNLNSSPPKLSARPTEWAHAELPACSNICGVTTICVYTGDCQCVTSSCVERQRFPFFYSQDHPSVTFPPPPFRNISLMDRVEQSSWRSIIRPQAAQLIRSNMPFPKIYVAPLSPSDQEWVDNYGDGDATWDIGKLKKSGCMSADAQLERGISRMGEMSVKESEMTFVRNYQARYNSEGRIEKTYNYTRYHLEGFDVNKVIIPFTFDWAQCLEFKWDVWSLRATISSAPNPVVRSTTAWSVQGDLNAPCYRPHMDVVIPPRAGLSPELYSHYLNLSNVRPSRERHVLAAFHGTVWGTGRLNRHKTMCHRANTQAQNWRLYPGGPVLETLWGWNGDYDYIGMLGDTIFCPQPAGIAGWSYRMYDAIYAGCIPVLIGGTTHHAFWDVLDWSKFSVQVESAELSQLEDVLLSRYSLDDIERLQTNLILVRDAFMYPLDEATPDEAQQRILHNRGPLFFALHTTRMRMLTTWPVDKVYDRP